MIVFTGSDWCGWSIRLAYDVFLQKDFRARAEGRYVLVYVDFPRKPENKAKVQDAHRNQELNRKFHVRGYPTVILTDAEGRPFGSLGYDEGGVDGFLTRVGRWQTVRIERDNVFREIDSAEGQARLHLQAATLFGVTHQTAEAAKYIDAALAYQPKNQELREELAGIAAALHGAGAGTGFVVATGGLVLTNHHVIERAKKVVVQIPERKEPISAKVIASDKRRDLALLKLDLPADVTLAPIPVARRTVGRGAKVAAFGFPVSGAVGSGLKLTTGIVSAEPDDSTRGMLLLDCRINPGNSGGPLCDVRGNVVGVVTAKSVGGYGVESFGMALPSDVVHAFLSEHLPKDQKVAPPVRAKKVLEWDEIDAQVKASVLLIVHAQ
jgi:S1-C subfamily serine protease